MWEQFRLSDSYLITQATDFHLVSHLNPVHILVLSYDYQLVFNLDELCDVTDQYRVDDALGVPVVFDHRF